MFYTITAATGNDCSCCYSLVKMVSQILNFRIVLFISHKLCSM